MGNYINWLLDNDLNEQEIKRLSEHTGISEEDIHSELLIGDFHSESERLMDGIESFSKEFPNKEYLLYGTGRIVKKFKFKIKDGRIASYDPIIIWQEDVLSTKNMDRKDVVEELMNDYFDLIDTTKIAVSETTDLRKLLYKFRKINKMNWTREEMIDKILRLSGDEFETKQDIIVLAKESEDQLKERLKCLQSENQ